MFKILRRFKKIPMDTERLYTYDEVYRISQKWGDVRYNDGKRDGLDIARKQAVKQLKEVLWLKQKTQ